MSVLTVPRIRASEALLGASSDLAGQSVSLDMAGPSEGRFTIIYSPITIALLPWVFVLVVWHLGA